MKTFIQYLNEKKKFSESTLDEISPQLAARAYGMRDQRIRDANRYQDNTKQHIQRAKNSINMRKKMKGMSSAQSTEVLKNVQTGRIRSMIQNAEREVARRKEPSKEMASAWKMDWDKPAGQLRKES